MPKLLPKVVPRSCFPKLFSKTPLQSGCPKAAMLQTCSPKLVSKAAPESCSPKLLPKAAPQSCVHKGGPQSWNSSKLPCKTAPQSSSLKLLPCAAPQNCAQSCSPKLLPQSCGKLLPKVAAENCSPKLCSKATPLFFCPTPSWLPPGRYTRSIAAKRWIVIVMQGCQFVTKVLVVDLYAVQRVVPARNQKTTTKNKTFESYSPKVLPKAAVLQSCRAKLLLKAAP